MNLVPQDLNFKKYGFQAKMLSISWINFLKYKYLLLSW